MDGSRGSIPRRSIRIRNGRQPVNGTDAVGGAHEELIVGSAVSMNPSTAIAEVPPKPGRSAPLVLAGLLAGLLLGFMDVTIVSTAAPTIIADLGGLNLFAWVSAPSSSCRP